MDGGRREEGGADKLLDAGRWMQRCGEIKWCGALAVARGVSFVAAGSIVKLGDKS